MSISGESNRDPQGFFIHNYEWMDWTWDTETPLKYRFYYCIYTEQKRKIREIIKKSQHISVFFKVCESSAFILIYQMLMYSQEASTYHSHIPLLDSFIYYRSIASCFDICVPSGPDTLSSLNTVAHTESHGVIFLLIACLGEFKLVTQRVNIYASDLIIRLYSCKYQVLETGKVFLGTVHKLFEVEGK